MTSSTTFAISSSARLAIAGGAALGFIGPLNYGRVAHRTLKRFRVAYSSISRSFRSSSAILSPARLTNSSSAIRLANCRYFKICISRSARSLFDRMALIPLSQRKCWTAKFVSKKRRCSAQAEAV
jgi:hypothetical protein